MRLTHDEKKYVRKIKKNTIRGFIGVFEFLVQFALRRTQKRNTQKKSLAQFKLTF